MGPVTEEVVCQVSAGDKADVDLAVSAAREAFKLGSPWRTMDASQRGKLMYKLADLMKQHRETLVGLVILDNGKPVEEAELDVDMSVDCFQYYAGWCDKIHGQVIPADGTTMTMTRREPVGVVGQIIPWNYPVMMVAWKWGPALAAGCTIVLKPAELTPISSLYLGALVKEAGFPPG